MRKRGTGEWFLTYIFALISINLAMLVPFLGPMRKLCRIGAFGLSIGFMVLFHQFGVKTKSHPAKFASFPTLLYLFMQLFNPDTVNLVPGLAQIFLYFSIMAPLFWANRLQADIRTFKRVIIILFFFHLLSSFFGILQVYYPHTFQFQLSGIIQDLGEDYIDSLKITLSNGMKVLRPMGLTNVPGGVAISGFYAGICGIGLLMSTRIKDPVKYMVILGGIMIGLAAIYLSQVRLMLGALGICFIAFGIILSKVGHFSKVFKMGVIFSMLLLCGIAWVIAIGGEDVAERWTSLLQHSPGEIYTANRGYFLEHTFNVVLRQNPFGVGLGRWGMIYHYFTSLLRDAPPSLWSEIQWTGWAYDGGFILVILNVVMIFIAIRTTWKLATTRNPKAPDEMRLWAALIFAYDIGIIAMTFASNVFVSQIGMEFWFLNAILYASYQGEIRAA